MGLQYDSMSCDIHRWPPEISSDVPQGCFKLSKIANYIMCMIDDHLNQLLSFYHIHNSPTDCLLLDCIYTIYMYDIIVKVGKILPPSCLPS